MQVSSCYWVHQTENGSASHSEKWGSMLTIPLYFEGTLICWWNWYRQAWLYEAVWIKFERQASSEQKTGGMRSAGVSYCWNVLLRHTGLMYSQGSVGAEKFTKFVEECLLPQLQPFNGTSARSVVILDNASIQHAEGIVDLIQSTGALVQFLPPYSSDIMPIEELFSKIKGVLQMKIFSVRKWT